MSTDANFVCVRVCACTNYAMYACYINTLTDEQRNGTRPE